MTIEEMTKQKEIRIEGGFTCIACALDTAPAQSIVHFDFSLTER